MRKTLRMPCTWGLPLDHAGAGRGLGGGSGGFGGWVGVWWGYGVWVGVCVCVPALGWVWGETL